MPNTEPFVQAACIAHTVVMDSDGVATVVRIVDTFTVTEPPDMGQAKPAVMLEGLIILKSGDVKGEFPVELVLRAPDGKSRPAGTRNIVLEGGIHGQSIKLEIGVLGIQYGEPYWLDVLWGDDKKRLTSIPFRFKRAQAEPAKEQTPA